jgi:16S rRNA (cytidine1402-2'-O)-methyltransferase
VATPIGNLGDLSPRAVETLAAADAIACEDTRRIRRLLTHAGIRAPALLVVNEHTESRNVDDVLRRVARGERVAVVTDAGMPGISDPGQRLVAAAVAAGHRVEVVPGPSAATAALAISGLPTGRFAFEGFLPRKGSARTERLAAVASEPRTVVLYESPHRLVRTLVDLERVVGGDRQVAIARELTKLHEEVWRGPLAGARGWAEDGTPRGEFVIIVSGAPPDAVADDDRVAAEVQAELARGASARDAAAVVAARLGVSRRRAYAAATRRSPEGGPVEAR